MPQVNKYQDINKIEKEAKRDYVDRHSPFIECPKKVKRGVPFPITIHMGKEYPHPDDHDHHIANVDLFNRETKLFGISLFSGILGGQDKKGNNKITVDVVLDRKAHFVATAYCTKHGVWESDPIEVEVD